MRPTRRAVSGADRDFIAEVGVIADDILFDLAHRIRHAQDNHSELVPSTAQTSIDIASAYAIADRVHRMRLADGAIAAGRKIGFTNRNIWDEYGVRQPIWGWMYEYTLFRAVNGRARLAPGVYVEPRIEPEIVFHFASAPPRRASAKELLACIDWMAHGFEIVQSHFPDWKFQVADTIMDGGLHGALVLGEPVPVVRLGQHLPDTLTAFEIDLACNGEHRETGRGTNVLDSPLNALAHLASILADTPHAEPITAGEIVTTGTLTAAYPVRPGERWHTALRGLALPGLTLDLVA